MRAIFVINFVIFKMYDIGRTQGQRSEQKKCGGCIPTYDILELQQLPIGQAYWTALPRNMLCLLQYFLLDMHL